MTGTFEKNPHLNTIKPNWPGTPLDSRGRFVNHLDPVEVRFADLWKWQTGPKPDREAKRRDNFSLTVRKSDDFLKTDRDCLVWFGHATYFIRLAGKNILIDPVLGNISFFLKRRAELPIGVDCLRRLDYVLLSHDHRDHADEKSLKMLAIQNPNTWYLTGLRNGSLLRSWTRSSQIQEAGWYQQFNTGNEDLQIIYLPSRHWCRRFLIDTNHRLWGGFLIRGNGCTIYFGGDSGYGAHFQEIGNLFSGIDIALLGIGAYKPEWFMSPYHTSPGGALNAFRDLGAQSLIPMHYGTFDLSDEPLGDPPQVLRNCVRLQEVEERIILPDVGEVIYLS